jgi:hypothetical protein
MAFGLLLAALPHEPRVPRIAEQLALTADRFVGAALHDWARIDPTDTEVPRALARPGPRPAAPRSRNST